MTNKCLSCSFLLIDNFYENPDEVRTAAISTKSHDDNLLNGFGYNSNMFECNILTGFFQQFFSFYDDTIIVNECKYFFSYDYCHLVHKYIKKLQSKWVAMLFLTPDISNYLEFFVKPHDDCSMNTINNDYGISSSNMILYSDTTRWKITDRIKTRYNRLIIFNSDNYFALMKSIGNSIETSQIIQIFVF
jgi:hypothetical protein